MHINSQWFINVYEQYSTIKGLSMHTSSLNVYHLTCLNVCQCFSTINGSMFSNYQCFINDLSIRLLTTIDHHVMVCLSMLNQQVTDVMNHETVVICLTVMVQYIVILS